MPSQRSTASVPAFSRILLAIFFLTFLLVAGPKANAQDDANNEQGLKPFGTYQWDDIDQIDLMGGNVKATIPLLSYPQRGGKLSLGFFLSYSAPRWSYRANCTLIPCTVTVSGGAEGMVSTSNLDITMKFTNASDSNGDLCWQIPAIVEPDGASHTMAETATNTYQAIDGSGYRLNGFNAGVCPGTTFQQGTIVAPNGLSYTKNSSSTSIVADTNGNQITEAFVIGTGNVITDTMGRTINDFTSSSTTTGCVGPRTTTGASLWTVPTTNGASTTITFCYAQVLIQVGSVSGTPGGGTCAAHWVCVNRYVSMLQAVILPNGRSWIFSYLDGYGELSGITYPTGGTISYAWNTNDDCPSLPGGTTVYHPIISSRTVNVQDGITPPSTWQYAYTFAGYPNFSVTTIMTDPIGNDTVLTGNNINAAACSYYQTQAQYYAGSHTSGTLVKTIKTDNALASTGTPYITGESIVAEVPIRNTTIWPNGSQTKEEFDYDSGFSWSDPTTTGTAIYGKRTNIRTFDYGTGAPGNLLRTVSNTYAFQSSSAYLNNNLLDLPAQISTFTGATQAGVCGANGATACTTYGYDEMTLQSSGITEQKVAGEVNPGNQTSVHRWLNGTSPARSPCTVAVSGGYVTSKYTYFDTGEVQQETDPCLYATSFGYSAMYYGAFLTSITNPLGQSTTMAYDFTTGLPTSTTDANQQTTTKTYDVMNRLTGLSYPDGGAVTYCYTDLGGPTCTQSTSPFKIITTKFIIKNGLSITSTRIYDNLSRLSQSQLNSDPDGITYTDTTYDAAGRTYSVSNPYRSKTDTTYGVTSYTYDPVGRTCVVAPPDATPPSAGSPCPSSQPSNTTFTTYSGNCTSATDQTGKARKLCSDGLGRLSQVFEDPTGLNLESDYTYDALNNLLSVNQKGGSASSINWRARAFVYDSLSRVTQATNPESGTISYSYDVNGNIEQKTNPAPDQTGALTISLSYCYDKLNRLIGKAYTGQPCPLSTPVATYTYDQAACLSLSSCYNVGRRTGMTDQAGTEVWAYDKMGRTWADQRTTNSLSKTFTYTYNVDGSMASASYPLGPNNTDPEAVAYQPGAAGRPLSLTSNASGFVGAAHYTPSGALCYLQDYWDGTWTAVGTFNSRLQPATYQVQQQFSGSSPSVCTAMTPTADIMDFTYNFVDASSHNNGNVQKVSNNIDWHRTQNFTYDSLNRISTTYTNADNQPAYQGDNSLAMCWAETYTYDSWGNLLSLGPNSTTQPNYVGCTQESGFGGSAFVATVKNQIPSFCYDAAGNLLLETTCPTGNFTPAYQYDAENHLTSTAGVTYSYDGDGRRVMKSSGMIYWYGTSSDAVIETDLSANFKYQYFFFGGQRVGREDGSNSVTWYFGDHLGSSRVVWSIAAQDESDFYPFGGERVIASGTANTYKFTSKERDSESGLDNLVSRYHASTLGRFISADGYNIVLERLKGRDTSEQQDILSQYLSDPQNLNKYSYALNNPLVYTDPDGRRPLTHADYVDLQKLVDYANAHPQDAKAAIAAMNALIAAINAVPDGAKDPAGLTTALWAAGQIGDKKWGYDGSVKFSSNGWVLSAGPSNKCNIFVAVAWGVGGGVGFGSGGAPVRPSFLGNLIVFTGAANVTSAQTLGDPNAVVTNFPVGSLQIGSIVAFKMNDPREAHTGIYLGGGTVAAAAGDMARVRDWQFLITAKPDNPPTVRDYNKP
jgi:RHS repeat-associated protein